MGRRRLNGERYPSGQLKRRKTNLEPMSVTLWRRIVAQGKQVGLDPRHATELGRLNWNGELTVAMTAMGHKIAEIYGRYEGYKRKGRSTRSPSYNASYGETGVAEELLEPEVLAERESRIREATEAFELLVGRASVYDPETMRMTEPIGGRIPPKMRNVIEQLCVEDKAINPTALDDVRDLLEHLSVVYKMNGNAGASKSAAGNGRHGPALHFNKHEDDGTDAPAKVEPKKPNLDRIFYVQSARRVAPELTEDEIGAEWDRMQAEKQREIFRRSKETGRRDNIKAWRAEAAE